MVKRHGNINLVKYFYLHIYFWNLSWRFCNTINNEINHTENKFLRSSIQSRLLDVFRGRAVQNVSENSETLLVE